MSIHDRLRHDVSLAPLTTLGVGGHARSFLSCTSVDDIREALQWAQENNLPVHILGGGSNTVFADAGFPGLVLHIALRGITFAEEGTVEAAAGEEWDPFVETCIAKNLAGIECLSGIPGQVGAVPIQNVGAYGQEVAQTIERVTVLDRSTLEERTFMASECAFGYRTSRFKTTDANRFIVTGVTFRLRPGGEPTIAYEQLRAAVASDGHQPSLAAVRKAVIAIRKQKSMVIDPSDPDTRSCGSFFENITLTPEAFATLKQRSTQAGIKEDVPSFPNSAGIRVPSAWLIEHAGFRKGFTQNGAGISTKHTLALVNRGGTAAALLQLAADIQQAVQDRFGVELRQEPVVVE